MQARVRLISTLAMCVGLLLGGMGMYLVASTEDDQVMDERVERMAHGILQSTVDELAKGPPESAGPDWPPTAIAQASHPHSYQIWLGKGTKLFRSHNASPSQPIVPTDFLGLSRINVLGETYATYSIANPDRSVVVQVAEHMPSRITHISMITGKYLALMVPPFALMAWVIMRLLQRAFRTINSIARDLQNRGPQDVSPVSAIDTPRELYPIVQALDKHLERTGRAMSVERRFTSVAGHELRTPLAGIRAQAQLAAMATDPIELQDALSLVMRGVDRASRLVDQLIDLNRVESTGRDGAGSARLVDLCVIYERVMEELDPKAVQKQLSVEASFAAEQMWGFDFAIYLLVRNLVANAIQYCPAGGHVKVHSQTERDHVVFTVEDSGIGIPQAARQQVFEKFNRLGRNGTDGVGLGLSIVANVVDLHGARIDLLQSALGGLRARVAFPVAPADASTAPVAQAAAAPRFTTAAPPTFAS
jgi:signal transduction histidine kinase